MDAKQKEIQQGFIKSNLTGIGAVVLKLVQDRDAHAAELTALVMHGASQFTTEYIEGETSRLKNRFAVKMRETFNDIEERLENLRKLLVMRDETLDLSNPALSTALTLIQAAGGEPSHDQAVSINQNFKHDQQALRAIYSAYGRKDIGGIVKMMYNPDEVIAELKKLADDCTIREGSVNFFASRLAKFAAIEGVELIANPDDRGTMEAMRRGAGLK